MNIVRLGQLGGNKNSFFGAKFNNSSSKILACTFTGCFYLWESAGSLREWQPAPTITGHARQVTDIDWGQNSNVLISTSHDQTSRIYTWWNNQKLEAKTWHEVSRAQVHGYDINAIKFLSLDHKKNPAGDDINLCSLLVCGADEKILRVLEPPAPFVNTVNMFTDAKLRLFFPNPEDEASLLEDRSKFIYKTKTEGGYSVLGLMIKATKVEKITCFFHDEEDDVEEIENTFDIPYDYKTPPIEDYLYKHTLWPEINKLYGHGYEIVSISTNRNGTLIASTCKSQTAAHSTIFLWDPQTCQLIQKLGGHNYTVLQVRFSHSGNYLAAVSRDRQTSLFRKGEDGLFSQQFLKLTHTKLIYSVAISSDDKLLAAGSRDKTLKLWEISDNMKELTTLKFEDGVTSLEFAAQSDTGGHLLWVGLENGKIKLLKVSLEGQACELISLQGHWNHHGAIHAIRYGYKQPDGKTHVVASCGEDHSVRIYEYILEE
jgi:elongator complex protein 2